MKTENGDKFFFFFASQKKYPEGSEGQEVKDEGVIWHSKSKNVSLSSSLIPALRKGMPSSSSLSAITGERVVLAKQSHDMGNAQMATLDETNLRSKPQILPT